MFLIVKVARDQSQSGSLIARPGAENERRWERRNCNFSSEYTQPTRYRVCHTARSKEKRLILPR